MTARADLPSITPRPPGVERGRDATAEHHSPEESVHLLRAELDACRAEIDRLRKASTEWEALARARGRILVAYRTGGNAPYKAIDRALLATERLEAMGADRP